MPKKDQAKQQQEQLKHQQEKQKFEEYQKGVVEDQLENNRGIHHFNNQSR